MSIKCPEQLGIYFISPYFGIYCASIFMIFGISKKVPKSKFRDHFYKPIISFEELENTSVGELENISV